MSAGLQWIAEDPFHVVVRSEIPAKYDLSGRMLNEKQRRLFAKFTRGVAPGWAQSYAEENFEFARMPGGVTKQEWLSYYDSKEDQERMGWTDEEREAIEEKLLSGIVAGIVQVEAAKAELPYELYKQHRRKRIDNALDEILGAIASVGPSLAERVKAYEQDHFEEKKSQAIIDAVSQVEFAEEETAEEPELVSA